MKKSFAVLLASLTLFSTPLLAQTTPAAPEIELIKEAPLDPATEKAVKELLVSMKFRESLDTNFKVLLKRMPAMILQNATAGINRNAKLTPEEKKAALEKAAKDIPVAIAGMEILFADPAVIEELNTAMVPLYARHFTLAEIKGLSVFYRTELGQKMLSTMPQILGESVQLSQQVIGPRIQKVIEKVGK
jgi:hypothetical protein